MSSTSAPRPTPGVPARPARPAQDLQFGRLWPEQDLPARPRLVVAAVLAGLLAAAVVPFRDAGLGTFLVLMAVCAVVAVADGRLRTPYHLVSGALCTLLVATVVVRDAQWVVALCLLAAAAVGVSALAEGRSVTGILAAGWALPLAALRGMPWLARSVTTGRPARSWLPAVRTAGTAVVVMVVFGSLFASADAVFASWADSLTPDLTLAPLVLRGFVTAAVAGLALTGVYVALNPPHLEHVDLPPGRPVARAFEWLVPVGVVVAVTAVFVAAQATAMFGGHAYLHRTTGLTYASYVHEGFWQLTVATVLTLVVVGVTARKAGRASARDRLLLRAVLGALCLLTLVVVASALFRMHVYEQAYGFTRLRLLVSVFEGWLGLVVVLVMVAGLGSSGRWVPRAALLTGATALLLLAASNPDASIARHNLERFQDTGADTTYLLGLSADADPVLGRAGIDPTCGPYGDHQPRPDDDWLEWNLGRHRSAAVPATARCTP